MSVLANILSARDIGIKICTISVKIRKSISNMFDNKFANFSKKFNRNKIRNRYDTRSDRSELAYAEVQYRSG